MANRAGLALAAALALGGCGYVGPPKPPSLEIPFPVSDLSVGEYGANILIRFTLPALTTDGITITRVKSLEVVAGPGPAPFTNDAWAATARHYPLAGTTPGPIEGMIPAADFVGQSIVIGVRSIGIKGKPSGFSNLRLLTVGAPLVKPFDVKVENLERGVGLTWSGSGPKYRVYRTVGPAGGSEAKPERLGETDQPNYLDTETTYGTQYRYQILAFAGDTEQSEISDTATITPVDKFPPAVPAGLSASAGPNSIELAWSRNAEPDLQGYNVFRALADGMFVKIADLVPTPVYSDAKIEHGKRYRYAISAVDLLGNESGRSVEADTVAP